MDITDFIKKTIQLKNKSREGWRNQVGIEHPESVADHSYMCAMLALCIAHLESYNVEKLVTMALLHDIHEAITGDYDHQAKKEISEVKLREEEDRAINTIIVKLPKELRNKLLSIWLEYNEGSSEEAKIVKQIDQIELLAQSLQYKNEGYEKEKLSHFWENAKQQIQDENLKKVLAKMAEEVDI